MPRSSAYYRPRLEEDQPLRDALLELAGQRPTYGHRRLTVMLRRQGPIVNFKVVRRRMRELNIAGQSPQRRPRTTDCDHPHPCYPNLAGGLEVSRPEQVWAADITYIRLRKEFVHFAVLMDVFSRLIRGWHLGCSLKQELTITALKRALQRGRPEIHHSDQWVQYAATAYVELLMTAHSQISMASVGEPEDNGYAEMSISLIKDEEVDLAEYEDLADARRRLGRFLDDVYNTKRLHSSLGCLTPREFEQQWMEMRRTG